MRTDPESSKATAPDYVRSVNRAIDHVLEHLDRPLRLEEVAAAAGFSPFHFHRVFKALTGETLQRFVDRVRLERALRTLSHAPGKSLTEIALACGFGSSSDFSRRFRKRYGVPPSAFDVQTFRARRREDWEAAVVAEEHRHLLAGLRPGENPDGFEVELVTLPPRTVAYIRVANPYASLDAVTGACERLMAWADERGLGDGQWLGYQWDDPEIVAHADCRYDVGVVVPDVEPAGEIGRLDFPAMRVAQVELRGGIDLEMRCLDWLFRTWLPTSGFVPTDQPCFEAWIGRPFATGMEHFELHAQIPVARKGP